LATYPLVLASKLKIKPTLKTGSVYGERFNEPVVKVTFISFSNNLLTKAFSLIFQASWKTTVAATASIII
jgi:hypothetical protein